MKTARSRSRAGFSLVEVALALGVAAFCLIPLFGLVPIGVNTNHGSIEQTGAVNVTLAVISDLQATALLTPPAGQTSTVYGIPIPLPTSLPASETLFVQQDGALSGTVNQNAVPAQMPRYRVTLYFSSAAPAPANATNLNNAITVRVLTTWPALADSNYSTAPAQYTGSFETVAALIRN